MPEHKLAVCLGKDWESRAVCGGPWGDFRGRVRFPTVSVERGPLCRVRENHLQRTFLRGVSERVVGLQAWMAIGAVGHIQAVPVDDRVFAELVGETDADPLAAAEGAVSNAESSNSP